MVERGQSTGGGDRARVLLVDDHPMVRYGLTQLINGNHDMVVCGEAGDAAQAITAVEQLRPDLVVVDIALGGEDGLTLIGQLRARWPETRILALSMHSEALYAERALKAGAGGYVTKQQRPPEVIVALRRVLAGEVYLGEAIKNRLVERIAGIPPKRGSSAIESLTDRELAVLRLIGSGRATREIAAELHLSVKTINAHRDHIKGKLGIGTAPELARFATLWLERESGG